jgi:hypothetical protein
MERAGRAADRVGVATVRELLFREMERLTRFLEPL